MALDKRVVPVLLRGLDQRGPKQSAITGELYRLENMVIVKGNEGGYELVPRPGESAVSKTADVGSIVSGMRLATLGPALVLLTGTSCYRKALDQWHQVDPTAPVMGVETEAIGGNSLSWDSADVVYVNGYTVASEIVGNSVSAKSVVVTVKDSDGAPVIKSTLQTGDLGRTRVVVSGTVAIIFWHLAPGTIRAAKFDSAAPSSVGSPVDVTTNVSALLQPIYDVQAIPGGTVAVSWIENGTSILGQALLTVSSMAVGATVTYAGISAPFPIGYLTNDFSTSVLYLAHVTANGLEVSTFDAATLALSATTVYDASITADVLGVSGYRTGASVSVYLTRNTSNRVYDPQIMLSTGGAASTVLRSFSLASRVMSANSTLYALARYQAAATFSLTTSSVKGTYFLVDLLTGKAIAAAIPDKAGAANTYGLLPNLATAQNASTWLTSGSQIRSFAVDGSIISVYTGAATIEFTYQDSSVGRPVELNGVLLIPGAMPYLYDGFSLTEYGFPIGPEPSTTATQGSGGGMSASNTYAYAHVYAWTDATGQIHRSLPTAEFQVALSSSQNQVTHTIPALRVTRKTGVIIETYRRNLTTNETILRRVSSTTAPTYNNTAADSVTFVDQVSDTTAASGEPIYTNGDPAPLEHVAPPPCKSAAVHRGRLLLAGIAGDPAAIWFSKDVIPGFGVAFNDTLVSRLSTGEAVTAVGSVDSYAVACTGGRAASTWASSNDYPDDTGGGGVLKFEQYSGTVGCASPMHIARTEDGLAVWSSTYGAATSGAKGPWLIDRGLRFEQSGTMIEDDAEIFTPTAVVAVPTRNQVRYLGSASDVGATVGVALVREAFFKTWARWNYARHASAIVDATIWQGAVAYLTSDGTVYTETLGETVLDDLGFAVPHAAEIAAFNFGGVAGYQRIYVGQATGRVIGSGATFTLSVTQTIDGTAMAAKSISITGQAADSNLNAEWDPGPNGKCSAYSLRFADSGNSANCGFSLAAVTMLVGVKAGVNKLPPARRMT